MQHTARVFLSLCVLLLYSVSTNATGTTYYYFYNNVTEATGKGKVYATRILSNRPGYKPTDVITPEWKTSYDVKEIEGNSLRGSLFQVFTEPKEGYNVCWTSDKDQTKILSNQRIATLLFNCESASEMPSKPTNSFIAHYAKVSVSNEMPSLGSVTIDKASNDNGDEVTLTATAGSGSEFIGWLRKGSMKVYTDNPLKVTATERTEEYVALFNKDGREGIYTRMYRDDTKYGYFAVKGGMFSEAIKSGNTDYQQPSDAWGGFWLNDYRFSYFKDFTYEDPSTVLYLTGEPNASKTTWNNTTISCQGLNSADVFSIAGSANVLQYKETNKDGKNVSTFYIDAFGARYIKGTWNYDSKNPILMCGGADADAYWTRADVNDENPFFVKPNSAVKFTDNDSVTRYLTTLYTSFPYECNDKVTPYIVSEVSNSTAHLKKLGSQIVPAYFPVILACESTDSTQNHLTPRSPIEGFNAYKDAQVEGERGDGNNMLRGTFQYNRLDGNKDATFQSDHMRVLSVNSSQKTGFYKLTEGSALKANKCWLELPANSSAKSFSLYVSDEPVVTGIEVHGVTTRPNEHINKTIDNAWYNLQGQRVSKPEHGVFIRNGKKVVFK